MTEQLSEQLKYLTELQKIDSQIHQLKLDLEEVPAQKKCLEYGIQASRDHLKKADDSLKAMQMKQKELENEVLTKEAQVKKFQSQQATVKTNQEYSALTKEIQNATADKSMAEDEALKLMEEVDTKKKALAEEKKKLAEEETRHKAALAELERKTQGIHKQIEELSKGRQEFVPKVDADIFSQYERVLRQRSGVAIAPLKGESCSGCGLSLPPQVVNLVKLREEVIFCESCNRILYEE